MHCLIRQSHHESHVFYDCAVQTSHKSLTYTTFIFTLDKTTSKEPMDVGPGPVIFETVFFSSN